MKKIIILLILMVLVTGCRMNSMKDENTPREVVEEYLESFQQQDDSIIETLKEWIESMDMDNPEDYQDILEKQYQNLSYTIIEENIDEDQADVEVEIEVLDYNSSILQSTEYFKEHQEEFMEQVVPEEEIESLKELAEYRMKNLRQVEDKVKYSITFHLIKEDNTWKMDKIDNDILLKLYGLY